MQTRSLSERIAEWKKQINNFNNDKTLHVCDSDSGDIADELEDAEEIIEELQAENQALLAKNAELELEIEDWKKRRNLLAMAADGAYKRRFKAEEEIEALESKVKELEGRGWLPIESAPKDSARVLLGYCGDGDYESFCTSGRYIEALEDGVDYMGHDGGFMDDDFQYFRPSRSFGNPGYFDHGNQPTHWMSLPKPPTKTKESDAE